MTAPPASTGSPAPTGRSHPGSPTLRVVPKLAQLSNLPPLISSGISPTAPSLTTSPTGTSMHSSPDALHARSLLSHCPTPLQLPDAALTSPSLHSQTPSAEQSPTPTKNNLIRRVSRSAMNAPNRLLRHRQSSNNVTDRDRDRSSGPLVMRRQSSGNGAIDLETVDGLSDLNVFQLPDSLLTVSTTSWPDTCRGLGIHSPAFGKTLFDHDEGYGIAVPPPKIDKSLQRGTKLTKVTRKKRKELTFVLDPGSVKITWHPSDSTKRLYIDDILEIRKKSEAANYRQEFGMPEDCESRWFTIIYTDPNRLKGRPTKSMHLVAPDGQTFDKWIQNLEQIIENRQRTMQLLASGRQGNYDKILPQLWRREMDKSHASTAVVPLATASLRDESIDYLGVQTVCRSLHMDCDRVELKEAFRSADERNNGRLTYHEFRSLFSRLKERSDIMEIYKSLLTTPDASGITVSAFSAFLRDSQGVDIALNGEKWLKVFKDCIRHHESPTESPISHNDDLMDLEAFTFFLTSPANDTLRSISDLPKLDKPLNQYFISSSHNTYLLGRQVAGSSSTEAYVTALKKGCRCVEIDCWDGEDGRPMVTHGRTLTTSVPFQDCISVIAKYAFYASDYPLILSLEVHCNPAQQRTMREIMEKTLGSLLVKAPIRDDTKVLPSPEDLRHRILVKVKAHTSDPASKSMTSGNELTTRTGRQRSMSSPQSTPSSFRSANYAPLSSPPTLAPLDLSTPPTLPGRPSFCSFNSSTDESDAPLGVEDTTRAQTKPPKSKIIKFLGELGVYTAGYKYRSFAFSEARYFNHIFSLAEGDFESLCGPENRDKLEKHNARYLMRVYPGKKRVRSSNFNPLICWRRGAQMAALNWQTYDLGMQLNDAMFASDADSRGYVLKPDELCPGNLWDSIDESAGWNVGQKQRIQFSVRLISGQQLPRPRRANPDAISSPYVDIELLCAEDKKSGIATGEGGRDASQSGVSGIGAPYRRRSRVVTQNGYNPRFDEMFQLSLETQYPSLVFVRWSVWSSPDGRSPSAGTIPLATFTAKLSDLEQGYRHLPLYDHNGEKLLSTLFCQIKRVQNISVDGFGRDDREMVAEKSGPFKTFTKVIKRTLSSKENRNGTLSRKPSQSASKGQPRERFDDTDETISDRNA